MEKFVEFPGLGLEFSFRNYFTIGPVKITFYGLLIAIGLGLAMLYAFSVFRKVGVDPDKAIDAIIGGIIGGIIGARIYYVAFSWENYGLDFSSGKAFWYTFSRIFKTWEGGMAIYGGLIGAILVGVIVAKTRKIKISALLDVVGIGFLLGQGIGRWGNFFNVEAFGSNTTLPWGMTGPSIEAYLRSQQEYLGAMGVSIDPTMPVHPCFLYESIWCILGFIILALYLKHRKFDGEVFLMYLGIYGAERAVVEGLRTDSLMIGTIRISQLLAFLLFIASVVLIIGIRAKIKSMHDENFMKLYCLTEEGSAIVNGGKKKTDELKNTSEKEAEVSQDKSENEIITAESEDTQNG